MRRKCACAVLVVCVVAYSHAVSSQDDPGRQFVLSIKLIEETPEGAQRKILAEPMIAAFDGRPFSFESGGTVKPKSGEGDLVIGTRVTGKLQLTEAGLVQLSMKIRIGLAVAQEDDPMTDVVRTETLEFRTDLRPGKTKRLKCSATQWCEVMLSADAPADESISVTVVGTVRTGIVVIGGETKDQSRKNPNAANVLEQ